MERGEIPMKKQAIVALAVCSVVVFITLVLAAETAKQTVNYPEGYRQWQHVKSLVVQKGNEDFEMAGGIHHIYANKKAFDALTKGKPYPDGAVFVADVLTANENGNLITEGPRIFIGVMQKESKQAADTGGWAFGGFKDDTKERMVSDAKACFKCHEEQKDTGYVFSKYRQ
jgi:hypothetical protein